MFQLPEPEPTDGFCWDCDHADIQETRFFDLTKGLQKLKFVQHNMIDHSAYVKKHAKVKK